MTRRTLGLAVLSGALTALSFPTIGLDFLAWFCLVPLLLALDGRSAKESFLIGGIAGLFYFGGTVYWVTNSVYFYGNVPLPLAALITLLLCAYCALYPALFAAFLSFVRERRPALVFLAAPLVWTALELARTYVFTGFPWALLGYTQYRRLAVIQFADITGVYGVSFLVVLTNAGIAELISRPRRYLPAAVALAAVVLAAGYGSVRLHGRPGAGAFRVSVIQGNIEQDRKWDPAYQSEVIATYRRLTLEAAKEKPDLVIWPETATPFYFGGADAPYPELTEGLRRFVRSIGTPLLTGSPTYERSGGRYILRNSAFLLGRDGATRAVYHKIHLVPFGEYVPLKSVLFFVEKMVQAIGDFEPGREHTVMHVRSAETGREVPLATVICYEIIFPDLVRQFVDEGATVMTNITNDAWFGRTAAPFQHFSMAVFRAVENHVPVARAANTGISGFIDADGRILATSGIFTEAQLTRELVPGTVKTFYTRHGDLFSYLCVALATVFLLPARRSKPRDGGAG